MRIGSHHSVQGYSHGPAITRPVNSDGSNDRLAFADHLASDPAPATVVDGEIDRLKRELAEYNAAREREIQGRTMDPPAFQLALPVNGNGYMPFVTADQQKRIDRITDSYLGRPAEDFEKMWDELRQHNLHPEQLARSAGHFINLEGQIVPRAIATAGDKPAPVASTAWSVSGM